MDLPRSVPVALELAALFDCTPFIFLRLPPSVLHFAQLPHSLFLLFRCLLDQGSRGRRQDKRMELAIERSVAGMTFMVSGRSKDPGWT